MNTLRCSGTVPSSSVSTRVLESAWCTNPFEISHFNRSSVHLTLARDRRDTCASGLVTGFLDAGYRNIVKYSGNNGLSRDSEIQFHEVVGFGVVPSTRPGINVNGKDLSPVFGRSNEWRSWVAKLSVHPYIFRLCRGCWPTS